MPWSTMRSGFCGLDFTGSLNRGEELLRVGPYQGTLGCMEIAVWRSGVCGTAHGGGAPDRHRG